MVTSAPFFLINRYRGSHQTLPECYKAENQNSCRLHIDVDVIDPRVAPSNSYAVKDGLSKDQLFDTNHFYSRAIRPASLTIASYDPALDGDGYILDIINGIVSTVINNAAYHGQ